MSDEEKAYFDFGDKAFANSTENIKTFIQLMIPLISTLLTIYYALLGFVGVTSALKPGIGTWILIEPPVYLVISLGVFIIASFPVPYPMTVGDLDSIRKFRTALIRWKYTCTIIASLLFMIAMIMFLNLVAGQVGK